MVDPEARLASRGGGAHLCHSLHALTDARTGVIMRVAADAADGRAERRCALLMLDRVQKRHGLAPGTLAADAGYGAGGFLRELERRGITPHAAMPGGRIKGDSAEHRARRRMRRRQRSKAYRTSQRLRRFIEPVIGWCKRVGGQARPRFLGHERIQGDAMMTAAAWNLMRMTRPRGAT